MITGLFVLTAIAYAISCALFLLYLSRGSESLETWAPRSLLIAAVCNIVFIVADYLVSGNIPFGGIHKTLSLVSLLIVVSYLGALFRYRIIVLGGFITPVTLLFFLGAGLGSSVENVPPEVRSTLLPFHILINILGIVAFALAFAAAVAYLVQERLLRLKKIGGMFQRLPPLDQLDSLSFRLVTIGFPLLTVGIVTGTIWAVRLDPDAPPFTASQSFALVAWVVFAGVLLLRVAAGWRGRRAAIGT
ncbi:MAG: cytochrome c biogenesis protein CcsA, partial [Myxococcota bacterium]